MLGFSNGSWLARVGCALTLAGMVAGGKEEGKKHGLGRTGGSFLNNAGGQFITAAPIAGCEQGYVLAGDMCERLEYRAGTLVCPKGSTAVGDGCIVEEHVSAAILCPPGTTSVGGQCESVEALVPAVDCPKGWTLAEDGQQCIRRGKGKSELVCRDGWDLKHGSCYREDVAPARYVCPGGYLLEESGKKHPECIMSEIAPPEVFCPKGWAAEAGACVHMKKKSKEAGACPPGYVSGHKGICERHITQDAAVTCPPGMFVGEGKKGHAPLCIGTENRPVVPICKKGYSFANNRCIKNSKHEMAVECPKGYELTDQGGCFKQVTVEARTECPPGATLHGKHCLAMEEAPPTVECTKHTTLIGGRCVSHEIAPPRFICPDGFKKSKKSHNMCELAQIIVAEPSCPPDAHLSGKHCITKTIVPADAVCKKGDLTPRGCLQTSKKEPKSTCPAGFKKHKGQCTRENSLPAAFVCPQGSILQEKNQCLTTTVTTPRFSCPQEFVLDFSNNCVLEQVVPTELACPVNTVLTNGQCYRAAFVASESKKQKKNK